VPFSQTTITSVNPPVYIGFQVALSWTCSSPTSGFGSGGFGEGGFAVDSPATSLWFQIYIDRQLAWWGQTTAARIAVPNDGPVRVDIGTVLPGEEQVDFSADLPTSPATHAELSWLGGTFEGADIAGFRVFGSDSAGGSIDYSIVLADITAYPGGIMTDGFGMGPFGAGAFGSSAGTYIWESAPLTSGVWSFGVVPYDQAGNQGTPSTTSITITAPPLPPALDGDNDRLEYVWNNRFGQGAFGAGDFGGEWTVTLNWLASPG
jgi:hypothetical protein